MCKSQKLAVEEPTSSAARLLKSVFFVSNVHCASCVTNVREVLSEISAVSEVDVSILTHEIHVRHVETATNWHIANILAQAAFEVYHVTTYDEQGTVISELDMTPWPSRGYPYGQKAYSTQSDPSFLGRDKEVNTRRKLHVANCNACKMELVEKSDAQQTTSRNILFGEKKSCRTSRSTLLEQEFPRYDIEKGQSSVSSVQLSQGQSGTFFPDLSKDTEEDASRRTIAALPDHGLEEFMAVLSIGGMSCASCVNSITREVNQFDFVQEITVNLLTSSARVMFHGAQSNINLIIERIGDMGFEASITEVRKISQSAVVSSTFAMLLAITGMTCGSCVSAITHGVEDLPFIKSVNINLLSHSGNISFDGLENADKIIEKIEDLGYDASVTSVYPLEDASTEDSAVPKLRTVSIHVDGMFCHHCPEKVLNAIGNTADGSIVVEDALSMQNPIVRIKYTPCVPSLTIRTVLSAVEAVNPAFRASVYYPPTVEERSCAIQLHERRRLLSRLIFVLTIAIPTFLIGVVLTNLVPEGYWVRKYLQGPIWAGRVSRVEWALFIMATPIMIYGADLFHVRAAKEIYGLWRPGSRVPFTKRFIRFGSMNLLISAGTMVAYISSLAKLIVGASVKSSLQTPSSTYFDSVVFLTLFILAGRFLEAYSKAKTGDAVSALGNLRAAEAFLVEDSGKRAVDDHIVIDRIHRVGIDRLEIGDIVSVPHGTSPPADGYILNGGNYLFDERSLTGESKPVTKTVGDQVFSGSVNVGQPVQVRVSELGGSSMLGKIIAVVREGQSKRAPLERIADLLTRHFVPIITLIAVVTFIIWLALGQSGLLPDDYLGVANGGWLLWSLEFAIAVFVVACPCGLALAAPTALFVGGGLAAKYGILVKGGGDAFQEASRLDAIVFDKTGTLTEGGSLKVSDHEVLIHDPAEIKIAWAIARELEGNSNHPIATAIMKFCENKETASVLSADIHEITGQGMKGTFTLVDHDSVQYEAAIGSQRLMGSLLGPNKHAYFLSSLLSKYHSAGKSTAVLCLRRLNSESNSPFFTPVIVFGTMDLIRPQAVEVISQLHNHQVQIFMCTGDNETTAYAVADTLGIARSNVKANALPTEKADFIRQLQETQSDLSTSERSDVESKKKMTKQGRCIVAFVGDGVNDSPALAAADVSIAVASGSDVAINSASFILLNSDLSTILRLVVLSRRVFNRIRMNFGWALVYNLCLIPVAAGVFYPIVSGHRQMVVGGDTVTVAKHWRLSPVWAALAMAISSISVVSSSLALRVEKKDILRWLRLKN